MSVMATLNWIPLLFKHSVPLLQLRNLLLQAADLLLLLILAVVPGEVGWRLIQQRTQLLPDGLQGRPVKAQAHGNGHNEKQHQREL